MLGRHVVISYGRLVKPGNQSAKRAWSSEQLVRSAAFEIEEEAPSTGACSFDFRRLDGALKPTEYCVL